MQIGVTDTFEDGYMAKFRGIASNYGVFVEYARDAAARDIGLHFTQANTKGGRNMLPALAWFQMKGIMTSTLSKEKVEAKQEASLSLKTDHLRFWYLQLSPTYLVVYVQALDQFLVINIKRWVTEKFGNAILTNGQKSHTVKIALSEVLDRQAFDLIVRDNLVEALKTKLEEDDASTKKFLRDAEVVKWMQACERDGVRNRLVYTSWISKARSEARFEYFADGEWKAFRNHWQYMMGDLETAFPYVEFIGLDEEELESWMEDDDESGFAERVELANGTVSMGENCSNEFYLHELDIKLNTVGNRWAKMLNALEQADAIVVRSESGGFVSVAPWHARQL